jgi:DNA-nicking Smr family endonuclease
MRGKRAGSPPDDLALWDEVKKSVKPLRKRSSTAAVPARPADAPPPAVAEKRSAERRAESPATREAPKPPPLAKLDRRAKARVARGRIEIDARLDLHGFTMERAVTRLERFLASAQTEGAGLVLVITGKSGALRREVPHWLSRPELRALVIGFEEASPHHGGAGALYVRVRRRRE